MEKACLGEYDVPGLQDFKATGKMNKEVLHLNSNTLQALLGVNSGGIFRRSQLREALVNMDLKVQYKISHGYRNSTWSDDWASFYHACLMEVRKIFRNSKTCSRQPAWLTVLFTLLKKHNMEQTTDYTNKETMERVCASSNGSVDHETHTTKTSRPLMYRKSQSPSKESLEEIKTLEPMTNKATFFFDAMHDLAIMVCESGIVSQSTNYKELGFGTREYTFPSGTTWRCTGSVQEGSEDHQEADYDVDHDGCDGDMGDGGNQSLDGEDAMNETAVQGSFKGSSKGKGIKKDMGKPKKGLGKGKPGLQQGKQDGLKKNKKKALGKDKEGMGKGNTQSYQKGKGKGKGKAKGKHKGKGRGNALVTKVGFKTRDRHREHSKKWHQVYKEHLKEGHPPEKAKLEAGKAATEHVRAKFG